jgi:hypothetical protein
MVISSVANASHTRAVTPSKSSSDRQSNDENQASVVENKAQERAQQQRAVDEKLQQERQEDSQRRLDGRLIRFGQDDVSSQQTQTSFNRSRVNEAYSPPKNEPTNSEQAHSQHSHDRDVEIIDIVV